MGIPEHIKTQLLHKWRGKYDYSKSIYLGHNKTITAYCDIHGCFTVSLSKHRYGSQTCKQCMLYGDENPVDIFIRESTGRHGDWYNYSMVEMKKISDFVIIECPAHGEFLKSGSDHIRGSGCPSCNFDRSQPTAIYLMQMGAQVKIGISIDPDTRLAQLNRNNPEPAHIVATWTLEDFPTAHTMEQQLHQRLRNYHAGLTGFDGATEWFNTTPCHAEWVINKAVQYANEVCKL